jgi:ABC-2 type transport system ATP-binding protein
MRYGDVTAVDGLSVDVHIAEVTAVVGPNGAGKTTTLETCEGYRRPQRGTVRVLGLDPIADAVQLRPRVGVMLQSGGAWPGVRAVEALQHAASLHAHPLDVDVLVERLGLGACGSTPYRRLSGGQQQRLGLAMAVIGRPELVVLDEPTAGLDPQGRRSVWDLIAEMRARRTPCGSRPVPVWTCITSAPHCRSVRRSRSGRRARTWCAERWTRRSSPP